MQALVVLTTTDSVTSVIWAHYQDCTALVPIWTNCTAVVNVYSAVRYLYPCTQYCTQDHLQYCTVGHAYGGPLRPRIDTLLHPSSNPCSPFLSTSTERRPSPRLLWSTLFLHLQLNKWVRWVPSRLNHRTQYVQYNVLLYLPW